MKRTAARRKGIMLSVLMILLIALIGVYYFLTAEPEEEEATIIASKLDLESIVEVSYSYGNNKVDFVKEGDRWILGADADCPLIQEQVKAMVYAAANVNAERVVDDSADDYERFGLDHPDITIRITGKDGNTVTYYLSSYRKDSNGHYFAASGADKVYFLKTSLFNWFSKDLSELIEMDPFPKTAADEVAGFTVGAAGAAMELAYAEDPKGITWLEDSHWFFKNGEGAYLAADAGKTEGLLSAILSLAPDSCAYWKASQKELAFCGLDEPDGTLRINSEKPYTITVGNVDASGSYYYAMQSESPMVYLIKRESVDKILGTAPADLLPERIFRLDLKEVDQLTAEFNGSTCVVDLEWNDQAVKCKVNGNDAGQEAFMAFYDSVLNLKNEGLAEEYSGSGASPYISIIFHTGNKPDMILNIYQFNLNFYRVEFDGYKNLLAGERDVRNIAEKLNELAAR